LQFRTANLKNLKENWNLRFAILTGLYLVTTIANLQFRRVIPTNAGSNSPHDDLLGVRVASNLLSGNWLGNWDNLILGKPPGYSFYLYVVHFFPFQLVVFNQIVFCIFAFTFTVISRRIFLNHSKYKEVICYITYIALIFNPFLFSMEMSRVYRTSAHAIFVFIYLVLLLSMFNEIVEYKNGIKVLEAFRKKMILKITAIGLTYTGLVFLRSESFWILIASLPPLVILYMSKSVAISRVTKDKSFRNSAILFAFIALGTYFIPVSLIGQINNNKYGSSLVENYYSGNFANAIKDWQRVENGKDTRPYVIVSKGQREAVYKVSKNAALMAPSLELGLGEGWQVHACNAPMKLCDNSGGWFTWQLRDAAISTGLVNNEVSFQNFFLQISQDIRVACDDQALQCGPLGLGVGAKPLRELPVAQVIDFSYANLVSSIPKNFQPAGLVATPDQYGASGEIVNLYHEVVKYRAQPMNSTNVPTDSSLLKNIEKFYFPLQTLALYVSIVGYLLAWRHKKKQLIYASLGFGTFAILLCSIGVAIAQVSYGWRVEGPYLLPIQPILQFMICVGIFSLITMDKKMRNLVVRNK
jgi:hypothetical protein